MQTVHRIFFKNSRNMKEIEPESVDLVVTSPPYPMIAMWDEIFSEQSPDVKGAFKKEDGMAAFFAMHEVLDDVWAGLFRVVKPGGIVCINIGDAVRTVGDDFCLFPNHSRILNSLVRVGFTPLPCIIWRKQTNAPNKFMGSGMLPAGAYVTLEHEFILVARKGGKRSFATPDEKLLRRQSAIFWEERNAWFSDVWFDLKGTRQKTGGGRVRERSGAFPFELAYRLINMYSVQKDLVLDPFAGTGTVMAAAMASARNSTGFEIDPGFAPVIDKTVDGILSFSKTLNRNRLLAHERFVQKALGQEKEFRHRNINYGFPVTTGQEKDLLLYDPVSVERTDGGHFIVTHKGCLHQYKLF